jgi:hypothetical protein
VVSGRSFTDSLDDINELGADQLRAIALYLQQAQSYTWDQLGIPVNGTYPHITAGTNYRDHATRLAIQVTPCFSQVVSNYRLERQRERRSTFRLWSRALCRSIDRLFSPEARLGYILCGDYTDRWLLIKEMEIGGGMGVTGFAAGKGGESRFPVGSLYVVPEAEDFHQEIERTLYVNGNLRQRSSAGLMIWSPYKGLNKALADCKVPYFMGTREALVTPSCRSIPAGTLLLTGPPGGVMFTVATLWGPLSYLAEGDEVAS